MITRSFFVCLLLIGSPLCLAKYTTFDEFKTSQKAAKQPVRQVDLVKKWLGEYETATAEDKKKMADTFFDFLASAGTGKIDPTWKENRAGYQKTCLDFLYQLAGDGLAENLDQRLDNKIKALGLKAKIDALEQQKVNRHRFTLDVYVKGGSVATKANYNKSALDLLMAGGIFQKTNDEEAIQKASKGLREACKDYDEDYPSRIPKGNIDDETFNNLSSQLTPYVNKHQYKLQSLVEGITKVIKIAAEIPDEERKIRFELMKTVSGRHAYGVLGPIRKIPHDKIEPFIKVMKMVNGKNGHPYDAEYFDAVKDYFIDRLNDINQTVIDSVNVVISGLSEKEKDSIEAFFSITRNIVANILYVLISDQIQERHYVAKKLLDVFKSQLSFYKRDARPGKEGVGFDLVRSVPANKLHTFFKKADQLGLLGSAWEATAALRCVAGNPDMITDPLVACVKTISEQVKTKDGNTFNHLFQRLLNEKNKDILQSDQFAYQIFGHHGVFKIQGQHHERADGVTQEQAEAKLKQALKTYADSLGG